MIYDTTTTNATANVNEKGNKQEEESPTRQEAIPHACFSEKEVRCNMLIYVRVTRCVRVTDAVTRCLTCRNIKYRREPVL